MSPIRPRPVVLLGAQRFDPTLGAAVAELGICGQIATITAGWQERELDDDDLVEHLHGRTVNLRLHARGDQVFREDLELRRAHHERQMALRHRQDFYRIRLEHLMDADRAILQRAIVHRAASPELAADEARASLDAIRALDEAHLAASMKLRAAFEARWTLDGRPSVARHRRQLGDILSSCGAIAIAGGHVATLLNRLALFGITALIQGKPILAWSAGAMALCERVVLFHDSPPQGPGAPEVLDAGLAIVPGLVVLPQPEERLRLEQRDRVQGLARRFAPARCLAFPSRSRVTWTDGRFSSAEGVIELREDGEHAAFEPPGEARGETGRARRSP